ncbi:hypothetical protein POI8812_01747 [Pontivivens insulae]|uniref:Uncharacterized protein n=1 Tax=Pontivivens insulae TaxID=1639689 RepID=A0A2R8AB41_9RHOB|nr:hypothetical protein DFR53_3426 [Pontivivens insulae]SPF29437.1 hypothetical protein POI8812_01747 [Pontivivens insulae]
MIAKLIKLTRSPRGELISDAIGLAATCLMIGTFLMV